MYAPWCCFAPHEGQVLAVFAIVAPHVLQVTSFFIDFPSLMPQLYYILKFQSIKITKKSGVILLAADGSIVINTEIDNKNAQKELNRLNRQIQSLEGQLRSKTSGRLPLEENLNAVNARLEEAKRI